MSQSLIDHIRGSWRILVKEITAFGAVGAVGFIVDLSLFNFFFNDGQIVAKSISTSVATVVTYVGNRYLSFSHRARSKLSREAGFFFLINLIALLGALVVIGIFSYPLHFKHHLLVMNVVNVFTIGMGTVFRFWAYKRFVFLHPDRVAAGLPDDDPVDYDAPKHRPADDDPDEAPENESVIRAG
ncbi:MAG TPA: GtrA family protein [Jatrophihabitans sp.]|nr:GtrA family protein [Jatrophihabitans sp.]